MLKKLIEWIVALFGKKDDKKPEEIPAPTKPEVPTTPKPKPAEPEKPNEIPVPAGMPPGKYVGMTIADEPYYNFEPLSMGKIGQIKSFLWKPISDTSNKPVVLVSCDGIPRDELFMEIQDKEGKTIKILSNKAFSRGNRLPSDTYGRISFQSGNTGDFFKSKVPFVVRFYQLVKGRKVFLDIMGNGNGGITITDVNKRIEKR